MTKKEARKTYRLRRSELSDADQNKWDDLILIQLQALHLPFLSKVMSFYPIEAYREIDSFLLTDYLHFRNPNLEICYPKMHENDATMQAIVCNADSIFEQNGHGIFEPLDNEICDPEDLDAILIPLLSFDEKGCRVGYGKGYYDRFLASCRPDCLRIGVSYFEAIDVVEDANEFDIPLSFCITPHRTYVF